MGVISSAEESPLWWVDGPPSAAALELEAKSWGRDRGLGGENCTDRCLSREGGCGEEEEGEEGEKVPAPPGNG